MSNISPKKGRKRVRQPENWKDNARKTARNLGKEYVKRDGKQCGAKIFRAVTSCCKQSCYENLTVDIQETLFTRKEKAQADTGWYVVREVLSKAKKAKKKPSWLTL